MSDVEKRSAGTRRDLWVVLVPAVLVIAAAFAVTLRYIKPAPPRSLVMAVPRSEGGAAYFAKRYQAILARSGVTLELKETSGSIEALKLLADAETDVEAAFVQGGLDVGDPEIPIESLASLTHMPLWVFYRGEPIDDPRGLAGKRIAIGPAHGGTHALARTLLDANGISGAPTQLLAIDLDQATAQLAAGEIDALFVVSPAENPAVKKLVTTPGLNLMSFARADAYTRRWRYLQRLVVPRGVYDLAGDLPASDVQVVSTTSRLVVTEGIHPALSYLLLRAASEVHHGSGLLDAEGEFPRLAEGGFPRSAEAKRYFSTGTPLLQRYLPFWAASLVERMWVVLLPLVAVLLPIVRIIPPVYAWRVRRRIYRWYTRLKAVERELETPTHSDAALDTMLLQLDELELAFRSVVAPLPYSESVYAFRRNIDLVRKRVLARRQPPPAA